MLRFWLLGLLAVGFATADYYDIKTADKEFLIKQKKVYNVLYHISQPNLVNIPLYNEGRAWSIQDNLDSYSNRTAVKEFLQMYQLGMLPRGEVFSVYYPKMLKQMEALFNVFYTANDFDVFYNTALWARININEVQFIFALYNAVIRRPDTQYIQLPPPYEMYPYAFFNSEVLEKAHHAKMFGKLDPQKSAGFDTYIIPANYSGWYVNREYDLENKLNYFTEDIGLSAYYFYFRQNYPCWLKSKDHSFPNYRGVEYLYGHKQLINRYNLERLSNDLPKIGDFDWQRPFYAGYYPSMTYQNGLPLPQRPQWTLMPQNKFALMKDIMNMEFRVSSAIDSGYIISIDGKKMNIYTPEGLNMLGNIIEGNADSTNMNLYGSIDTFGRKILGFNPDATNSYQIVPSALEMFSTSMRDPAFYRLYKRIVDYYYRYKMRQQPYNKEDIVYPNLVIESFTVDKLITYFDQFDASISNGLLVESQAEAEKSLIKIRQYRLNHKPFNFHMAINAANPTKASIKIFLGPKYDSHHKLMELPENLKDFYEIDNWMVDLNAGTNKIVRSSKNIFFLSPDQEPSELFYQRLLKSIDDGEEFNYAQRISGFPERLLLPRGKREGMPFQLFVYVNPVSTEQTYTSRIWGNYKFDSNPFGFPLDKPVYDYNYDGPNMAFKDVLIYHKEEFDMNIPY